MAIRRVVVEVKIIDLAVSLLGFFSEDDYGNYAALIGL
jgi:hypothetical protein